jgi:type I restriction enzyme M protein
LPANEIIFDLKENDNKKKTESKSNILKMIDKAHNILYNSENIEGEDALNDIMNLIFIKSIQPIISDKNEDGKIDLLNKEYYKKMYDDDQLDEIFSYFEDLTNLSKSELSVIRNLNEDIDAIRQMGDILKTHPITKMIYSENNFLKAKKAPTIQTLLNDVINKINIKELELNEDVIGEIYEHIINGYVKKGSKLGQFFTPRKLMKLLLNYKKDNIGNIISKINKKDKIKLYDSCMGTGGWVVIGYNMLKEKYNDRLLLSGGEVKPSTFQYGLMNLILTLKQFPHDVRCESSLTHINKTKHHFVFTNPPFQTDKKFDQVKENFKTDKYTKDNMIKLDDVYLLKDNSPPIQFLELDIYKLEDNGMCIIVLPYGELFFGASYADNRKHFMKETNITDIRYNAGSYTQYYMF